MLGALFVAALFVGAATTPASADTVLTIEFVETHDRLDPEPKAGIIVKHTIEATLTADNHVTERDQRQGGGRNRSLSKETEARGAIGDNSAWATWRVMGPHQLERLFVGRGFLVKIDVEVGPGDACAANVAYLLRSGDSAMMVRRLDNSEPARVSKPEVLSAQCSIR